MFMTNRTGYIVLGGKLERYEQARLELPVLTNTVFQFQRSASSGSAARYMLWRVV